MSALVLLALPIVMSIRSAHQPELRPYLTSTPPGYIMLAVRSCHAQPRRILDESTYEAEVLGGVHMQFIPYAAMSAIVAPVSWMVLDRVYRGQGRAAKHPG